MKTPTPRATHPVISITKDIVELPKPPKRSARLMERASVSQRQATEEELREALDRDMTSSEDGGLKTETQTMNRVNECG